MDISKLIKKYWTDVLILIFLLGAGILYICMGENSYISVHDNLDLFIPQFQMMKDTHTFFAHGVSSPFLGGISRDVMPSEFALGTIFYVFFPSFVAYILNWFAKVIIGLFSFRLLALEVCGEDGDKYHSLINLCGFAYGIINFFPCFGIAFASIPLVVYLLLRIEREKDIKKCLLLFVALFCYPFISYFSYLGLFILAYMVVALIWISILRKRFDLRMLIAIIVLAVGYVAFEYRLFATMLFSDEVTIRATMVLSDFSLAQAVHEMVDVFVNNTFHADALTGRVVMPVCMAFFCVTNIVYIVKREWGKIFTSLYNLIILILIFDSVVYGLYTYKPMRDLVETLVPPLTGWQFDRTSFFNPFLWVCALFMLCRFLYDNGKRTKTVTTLVAFVLVCWYITSILLTPTRYNDLMMTALNAVKMSNGNVIDDFSYSEFYNTDVYEQALDDIGYNNEWSVAYGLYPAMLEYNGIYTLDGYLGFYAQSYKESFRRIIAPALELEEASRIYFDNWGARVNLYSGTLDTVIKPYKSYVPEDTDLYMDVDAFRDMGGRYIFSRFELTGEVMDKLTLRGCYGLDTDPYKLYVYDADTVIVE